MPVSHTEIALLVADLFESAGAVRQSGDAIAGTVGQTQARWQVLSVVSEGDWTVASAAKRLGITRQSVRRVVELLVAEELVRYELNPAHRGSPLVRLTPAGHSTIEAISNAAADWHAATAGEFSAEEVATTRTVLRTLTRLSRASAISA